MPPNGKRSRSAGHGLEKLMAKKFREAGYPHVVTTRAESVSRDSQGIDLINRDEAVNGRLPFNVQCKCSVERPQYDKLIDEMPQNKGVMNIVVHKYVCKTADQVRFQPRGHFVILNMEDFMDMVKELKELRATVKHLQDTAT
jgi:hypothetical protein